MQALLLCLTILTTTTAAATQQTVDETDPRSVARECARAANAGDVETVLALSVMGPREVSNITANCQFIRAHKELVRLATERFGAAGARAVEHFVRTVPPQPFPENMILTIDGDRAILRDPQDRRMWLLLVRSGGKWKFDGRADTNPPPEGLLPHDDSPLSSEERTQLTRDILDGIADIRTQLLVASYHSPAELEKALEERLEPTYARAKRLSTKKSPSTTTRPS